MSLYLNFAKVLGRPKVLKISKPPAEIIDCYMFGFFKYGSY